MQPAEILSPYTTLADASQVERTRQALEANGFKTLLAKTGAEAKQLLSEVIPAGAEVFTSSSTSLIQLGLLDEIDQPNSRYNSVRVQLGQMDGKTQGREMQKLGATPEYIVGSVHAISETGSAVIASMTGSQLAPYAASAAKVVWIVGTHKIAPTLEAALQRVQEYVLPLEDQRAMKAYGVHSGINKLLIYNREITPERVTIIFVEEPLGF